MTTPKLRTRDRVTFSTGAAARGASFAGAEPSRPARERALGATGARSSGALFAIGIGAALACAVVAGCSTTGDEGLTASDGVPDAGASLDGSHDGAIADAHGDGADGSKDATPTCPALAAAPAATATAPTIYPAIRYMKVGSLGPKVAHVCVDTSALSEHATLDAIVPRMLESAGVASADVGSCDCDWNIRFASKVPAIGGDAEATKAIADAASNPELYVGETVLAAGGRLDTTLYGGTEGAASWALRAALATLQKDSSDALRAPDGVFVDWPSVRWRGIVEGIYGPWSYCDDPNVAYHEPWRMSDRIEAIRLAGRLRMNGFVFGPKCDYYSEAGWAEPYPPSQAQLVASAAKEAQAAMLKFTWMVRPTTFDLSSYASQLAAMKTKIQQVHDLGARGFAVTLDDFAGFAPSSRVKLMNDIDDIVSALVPGEHIIVTGNDYCYCRNFTNGQEWQSFGSGLHPEIQIFWTGDCIEPDQITAQSLQAIDGDYQRKVTIWDNWPANDDKYTGRSADLGGAIQGLYVNPVLNEYPGPAHPPRTFFQALGPVGDYLWNTGAYSTSASYDAWQPILKIVEGVDGACTACKFPGHPGIACDADDPTAKTLMFCDPDLQCQTSVFCLGGCKTMPAGVPDECH